jgi:hypothetical protein
MCKEVFRPIYDTHSIRPKMTQDGAGGRLPSTFMLAYITVVNFMLLFWYFYRD